MSILLTERLANAQAELCAYQNLRNAIIDDTDRGLSPGVVALHVEADLKVVKGRIKVLSAQVAGLVSSINRSKVSNI